MTRRADQGGWPATGFGLRLRALRLEAGLTQKALGLLAGVHAVTVVKLEAGSQEPAWPLVIALAAALGRDTAAFQLRNGEEPPPPPPRHAKRGRPRKGPAQESETPKRKRGRPRKESVQADQ